MEKKFIDSTYIFRKFVNRALRTMRSTLMLLLRRLFLSLHRCLVSYRRFHLLLHCLHLIKANNIPLLITFYSLAHIALASFSLSLAFYIDVYYHWTNTWDDFWCIKSMRTNKVIPLMLITSVRHYLVERQTSTNETKEGNISVQFQLKFQIEKISCFTSINRKILEIEKMHEGHIVWGITSIEKFPWLTSESSKEQTHLSLNSEFL